MASRFGLFYRVLTAVYLGVIACSSCLAQGTSGSLRITFEGPPVLPPDMGKRVLEYIESGMWFRPIGEPDPGIVRRGSATLEFYPRNGTSYIQTLAGQSMMFSFLDNSLFDLQAMDLAEYSTVVPIASVRIFGYRPDGSSITTVVSMDGIIDGSGPLQDFETFQFGPEWSGLSRVEMPYPGWCLDNLVVAIPEPGTGAFLLTGVAVLCLRSFRRKPRCQ